MDAIFATLYEWGGLTPFYSTNLADHLRGFDITCSDYIDTNWYVTLGFTMLSLVAGMYVLQYHIIDSTRYNKTPHWWLSALFLVVVNILLGFAIPFNDLQAGDYCSQLSFSTTDCLGFGASNALLALVFFAVITSLPWPRKYSINCRHTMLLKF